MRIELCTALRPCEALAAALGADVRGMHGVTVRGIATDSRELRAGDLFIAWSGKQVNGADFIPEALSKGAVGVLTVKGALLPVDCPTLLVENIASALLRAAGIYREQCNAFLVAISGSTGKTTVKEAIATMLEQKGTVAYSEGNFNSTWGLPLSVLSFAPCDFWVVEIGINHPGEMEPMAVAVAPDLAVLTNVGHAHIGHYGTLETLCSEKVRLAAHLRPKGLFLTPFSLKPETLPCNMAQVRCFGGQGEFHLESIGMSRKGVTGDLICPDRVITKLSWSVPGSIGIATLESVGAVGALLGMTDTEIRRGLQIAAKKTPRMRSASVGKRMLIDDSYNASPEAVMAALEVLHYRAVDRPIVAVLADMLELGMHACALHREVGRAVALSGASVLFTYGEWAREIALGARLEGMAEATILSFGEDERDQLVKAICENVPEEAVILFKGSGKMNLSGIVNAVRRKL